MSVMFREDQFNLSWWCRWGMGWSEPGQGFWGWTDFGFWNNLVGSCFCGSHGSRWPWPLCSLSTRASKMVTCWPVWFGSLGMMFLKCVTCKNEIQIFSFSRKIRKSSSNWLEPSHGCRFRQGIDLSASLFPRLGPYMFPVGRARV